MYPENRAIIASMAIEIKDKEVNEFTEISAGQNYIYHSGSFWRNFNNLELFLRIYLNKKRGNNGLHVTNCLNMQLGDRCDENAITDYKTFVNYAKNSICCKTQKKK